MNEWIISFSWTMAVAFKRFDRPSKRYDSSFSFLMVRTGMITTYSNALLKMFSQIRKFMSKMTWTKVTWLISYSQSVGRVGCKKQSTFLRWEPLMLMMKCWKTNTAFLFPLKIDYSSWTAKHIWTLENGRCLQCKRLLPLCPPLEVVSVWKQGPPAPVLRQTTSLGLVDLTSWSEGGVRNKRSRSSH